MKYFNEFELLNDMFTGNINFEKYLAVISTHTIIKNLERENKKIPLNQTFHITTELMEEKSYKQLPQEIKDELSQIGGTMVKTQSKYMERLLQLKKIYPGVPCIYNFLANSYFLLKNHQKQFETIMETINRFPEYLFGKIALADYYRTNDMPEKIYDAFNGNLEIFQISPRIDITYHKSEIFGFYHNVAVYYIIKNQIDEALLCYCFLREIDKKHPVTKQLVDMIGLHELESIKKVLAKKKKK